MKNIKLEVKVKKDHIIRLNFKSKSIASVLTLCHNILEVYPNAKLGCMSVLD